MSTTLEPSRLSPSDQGALRSLLDALHGPSHPTNATITVGKRRGFAGDVGWDGTEDSAVMSESCWSVYIIRCGDGSLYTGIANNVERRFGEHVSQGPKAAKYLRGRLPLEIVYRKEIGSRSEASKEELRIKRMGVKGKVGLVNGG